MLVLSRKKNEGILVKGEDGDIRIVLIEVEGGKVRLGIEAPRGYSIFREELVREIEGANRLAAVSMPDVMRKLKGHAD